MCSCYRLAWILLSLFLATHTHAAEPAPPAPPGVDAFVGCKKYPSDKRFKWSVRGEVGVAELASSLGEISCRPIVVATALAQRGGKVVIEVPDLVSAADAYRLFYGALEAMGLTVDASGGTIKVVDAGRAREVAAPELDGAGSSDDRYVVRLMHPKQRRAAGARRSPRQDEEQGRRPSRVFGGGALVLIDRAVNVRRMEDVARALDVGEAGARIYTLQTHGRRPPTEVAASAREDPRRGDGIAPAARRRPMRRAPHPRAASPPSTPTCVRSCRSTMRTWSPSSAATTASLACRPSPRASTRPPTTAPRRRGTSSISPTPTPRIWRRRCRRSGSAAAARRHRGRPGRAGRPARRRRRRWPPARCRCRATRASAPTRPPTRSSSSPTPATF